MVGRVLVPASAAETARSGKDHHGIIAAVVDFVNTMLQRGHFVHGEILRKAVQARYADYYFTQVSSGGHSQLICNTGQNAALTFGDALAGLEAMGAAHADILRNMMQWVATNAGEAQRQTGKEGGRAPYLDQLDKLFSATESQSSMVELSARWILAWPELMIVADDAYPETLKALCLANPKFNERQVLRQLMNIVGQTTDRFRISIGLALTSLEPPELLQHIGAASHMEIEGRPQLAHHLKTTGGVRKAVVNEASCFVFDYCEPALGGRLAAVDGRQISPVLDVSERIKAGAAIATLLNKIGQNGEAATVSPCPVQQMHDGTESIRWLVRCGGKDYRVDTMVRGAVASTPDEDMVYGTVTAAEVDIFLDRHRAESLLAPQKDISLLE